MELRVTECCKTKGITLQDLADKLGVARSTLANTLTKKNPTLETLEKISKALGVKVSDLLDEEKNTITCPKCGAKFELKED
ncbi:MAG: helix-turn-helix transcriptional regulator [Tyzzerella sp.]|nr:helix-turn-helix transcriptional regulator [Tyzzerella sp.]